MEGGGTGEGVEGGGNGEGTEGVEGVRSGEGTVGGKRVAELTLGADLWWERLGLLTTALAEGLKSWLKCAA